MRPYSVMRMFEVMVVVVIEELVGDSFNRHFTQSMTLRSFPSEYMTLRSFSFENLTLRSVRKRTIQCEKNDFSQILAY